MFKIMAFTVIGYSICYLAVISWVRSGIRKIRVRETEDIPFASVIVCARNEEEDIPRCIESLVKIDYPPDKLEIIFVDDESTDRTPDILESFARINNILKIMSTKGVPKDLPAKQRPLNMAIESSRGEIVLITDADCAVSPGWVKSHVRAYTDETGIVGGFTRVEKNKGFFAVLQDIDIISKHTVFMGSTGNNLPLSIMGNNISFRREAYNRCGGLRKLRPTIVEDMALMNAIVKSGYKLSWADGKEGSVVSTPETELRPFVEQRRRWIHEMRNLALTGKIFFSMEILMMINVVLSIFVFIEDKNGIPLIFALISWVCGYLILMLKVPGIAAKDLFVIPAMLVFQLFYGIILAYRSLFGRKSIIWKGREYSG